MKESRPANFGAIQTIFLQLSWSQHKLVHSCQVRRQRSNGAINRNKHFFSEVSVGAFHLVTPSLPGGGGWGEGGGREVRNTV